MTNRPGPAMSAVIDALRARQDQLAVDHDVAIRVLRLLEENPTIRSTDTVRLAALERCDRIDARRSEIALAIALVDKVETW